MVSPHCTWPQHSSARVGRKRFGAHLLDLHGEFMRTMLDGVPQKKEPAGRGIQAHPVNSIGYAPNISVKRSTELAGRLPL